jgi:hypothetical protein
MFCDPMVVQTCVPDTLEIIFENDTNQLNLGPFNFDQATCPCLGVIGNPLQGEDCDNRRDDDRDTMIDCADPDCAEDFPCVDPALCSQAMNAGCSIVPIRVISQTQTAAVQGWSYSVVNDNEVLTLIEDTVLLGADAQAVFIDPGFNVTQKVPRLPDNPDMPGDQSQPEGFISAVVLSFTFATELVIQRNTLATASYIVIANPGMEGTQIRVATDEISIPPSPHVGINITVNGDARQPIFLIQGRVRAQGAPTEICNNGQDDDGDGLVDCNDPQCTDDPACPENCTNDVDDDADGQVDCMDSECTTNPVCQPETACNDGMDNDMDGAIDCADSDCAGTPACPPPPCPDYAFYFGPTATPNNFAQGDAASIAVSTRNIRAALAFQFGVRYSGMDPVTYTFAGNLGTDANRLIELLITDDMGNSHDTTNTTTLPGNTASARDEVTGVRRGAALMALSGGDFLAFDLAPNVGGPGLTVGYVSDLDGITSVVPATPAGNQTMCPVNEVLILDIGGVVQRQFRRGDADGNGRRNVTDAVLIIQNALGNLPERFDCDDARDSNDDGMANITDAIPLLNYLFREGPPLPEPFLVCGVDPTDTDGLTCAQDSPTCAPAP